MQSVISLLIHRVPKNTGNYFHLMKIHDCKEALRAIVLWKLPLSPTPPPKKKKWVFWGFFMLAIHCKSFVDTW